MANPYDVVSRPDGLGTHENDLSYEGQPLSVADNVVLNRDGMIERRRGFKDFSSNLPDFHPDQLFAGSNGTDRYLHLDSGLWYYDTTSSSWLRKRGALGGRATNPAESVILNGVLFFTAPAQAIVLGLNLTTGSLFSVAGSAGSAGSTDGTGAVARFFSPRGICTDGTNLYIGDSGNSVIRRIAPPLTAGAGVVTTVAGTAGAPGTADGTGSVARFTQPTGICFDGSSLFVVDRGNHSIRRIAPPLTAGAGVVTTVAGLSGTSGQADGTGTVARFFTPTGICFDGSSLFVADEFNHTIRRIAPPLTAGAGVVTTVAGTAITPGTADGTGAAARFNKPSGITFDGTNLYISDYNNGSIRKIAPPLTAGAGVVTTPYGLTGTSGTEDGVGSSARFSGPIGISISSSIFYISDFSSNSIRKAYPNGYVSTIAGIPTTSSTAPGNQADGIVLGPP